MSVVDPFKLSPGMKIAKVPGLPQRDYTGADVDSSPHRGGSGGRGGGNRGGFAGSPRGGGSPGGRGGRGGGQQKNSNSVSPKQSTPPSQKKSSPNQKKGTPSPSSTQHAVQKGQSPYGASMYSNGGDSNGKKKDITSNTNKGAKFVVKPSKKRTDRHIRFKNGANNVTFVNPPAKSENKQYWFTENEKTVRKALSFEIESNTGISVDVEIAMKITGMCSSSKTGLLNGNKRTFLDIREQYNPMTKEDRFEQMMIAKFGGTPNHQFKQQPKPKLTNWGCVRSSGGAEAEKMKVTLQSGMYFLRARGPGNLTIFAEIVDIARELI